MKFVRSGKFPTNIPPNLRSFASKRDELNVVEGCLMVGERIVIPKTLQREVLQELHASHAGMDHMKRLARSVAFWPGIDADCENFVRNCKACSLHSKTPRKVPLQPWPAPERVWQRIHIDFAGPDQGQWYLVVVDAKSKYPEVKIVHSISAANTVKVLKEIFARNGYPETIVSDNGTQFTSQQFADMCQNGHIQHIRTAPYCPQSNGQAERFVDTLKRALKKLQKGEEKISENILNQFLMIYRRTPLTVLQGKSAAQIHLGRQLRTELDALKPRDSVNPLPLTIHQQNMKDWFDHHNGAKTRSFSPGQSVLAKCHTANTWIWRPGQILKKAGKVNYEVDLGESIRRFHTNQLKSDLSHPYPGTSDTFDPCLDVLLDTYDVSPASSSSSSSRSPICAPTTSGQQKPCSAAPAAAAHPSTSQPNSQAQQQDRTTTAAPTQSVNVPPAPRRSTRQRSPVSRYDPSP
ncbi:unnamed protein product [Caenorhabditis auriculariae]|uniref:RNA-directed DNA polymerase n=1 Tax=Caenorhabditis auriculariae TaxID=2777116 RepID=A0A8S1HHJ2_9PELO|nr:unnamed protein product [Caenorhabditis auriculariae]